MPTSLHRGTTNAATIVFAGAATGSSVVGVDLDGVPIEIEPSGSDTAATTAAAWESDAGSTLSGYTISRSDATVTITSDSGRPVMAIPYSNDATQSVTAAGGVVDEAVTGATSTAMAGRPVTGAGAGYALSSLPVTRDGGAATVNIRAALINASGSAATAYWRLWVHSNAIGWYVDPSVGVRLISDGGSSTALRTDDVVSVAVYGDRVAVELVGKTSTGTDLDSAEMFIAWAEVV